MISTGVRWVGQWTFCIDAKIYLKKIFTAFHFFCSNGGFSDVDDVKKDAEIGYWGAENQKAGDPFKWQPQHKGDAHQPPIIDQVRKPIALDVNRHMKMEQYHATNFIK